MVNHIVLRPNSSFAIITPFCVCSYISFVQHVLPSPTLRHIYLYSMLYNYDTFIHFRQTICQVPCYSSSSDSIGCTYIHYGSGIHTSPSTVAQCFILRLHQYPHTQGFPLRNGLHIYNSNVSIIVCVFCSFTRIKRENIMSMVMTTVMTTEMTMVLLGRRI